MPLLRRDGTLHDEPGYDPVNRTFQHPTRELLQDVPRKPSRAQVKYAVDALLDILREFPFEDAASRIHALALMLTPYLRGVFDGPVPLFVVTGTSPGEGKSLLTRVCGLIATGRLPSILTEGETDQEYRKRITGHLQRGGTYAVFDNVSKPVGADSLAALLTSTIWSDRVLGRSVITELANNSTWVVTGNRVTLAGDIPRRCVLISLRTDQQRAWTRDDFKVPDLLDHVQEHLSLLQAACVTLCRAWGQAGMPVADVPAMGTFESWSRAVGSVLAFAGVDGFLMNRDRIQLEGDVAARDMEEFLREVQRCMPAMFRARDVLAAVKAGDIEAEALPDELGNVNGQSGAKKIGKAFRRWEGRRVSTDGLRIERVERDLRSRTWSWRVVTPPDDAKRKLARSSP